MGVDCSRDHRKSKTQIRNATTSFGNGQRHSPLLRHLTEEGPLTHWDHALAQGGLGCVDLCGMDQGVVVELGVSMSIGGNK